MVKFVEVASTVVLVRSKVDPRRLPKTTPRMMYLDQLPKIILAMNLMRLNLTSSASPMQHIKKAMAWFKTSDV